MALALNQEAIEAIQGIVSAAILPVITRLDNIDRRLDNVDRRLDNVDRRMDAMATDINQLKDSMGKFSGK